MLFSARKKTLGDTKLSPGNTRGLETLGMGNMNLPIHPLNGQERSSMSFPLCSLSQVNTPDNLSDISNLVIVTLAKHMEL